MLEREPVRLAAAITTALTASLSVLSFAGVQPELVAALNAALAAMVAVVFELVRGKVDSPRMSSLKQAAIDQLEAEALTPEPAT